MSDVAVSTSPFLSILASSAARVTELAAVASYAQIGRGNEMAADQLAVDAMRTALNELHIDGRIVIGEGERDEAPMLFIGEKVGLGGPAIDIALDPLEGTTLTAKAQAGALTVLAMSEGGGMLHAPDTLMDKIAIGPGFPQGVVDLDNSPAENVRALAAAKGVEAHDIAVCVLDRPRHAPLIAALQGGTAAPDTGLAVLDGPLSANGPREHYMRAIVDNGPDGVRRVRPMSEQDSSLVTVMAAANALVRRLPGAPALEAGARVEVLVPKR